MALGTKIKKLIVGEKPRKKVVSSSNSGMSLAKEPADVNLDRLLELQRASGSHMTGLALLDVEGSERTRSDLYLDYLVMSIDPLVETCLKAQVTNALGGDAQEGKCIYIEYKQPKTVRKMPDGEAKNKEDQRLKEIVLELADELEPMFNRISVTVAMNAVSFGDAYARAYFSDGVGITNIYCDELVTPLMVEPFERAGVTELYILQSNLKTPALHLTSTQMARAKMPRLAYVPQIGLFTHLTHMQLEQDDALNHELMPSLVGGSLLEGIRKSYRNLHFLLRLHMSQQMRQAIDENLILLNTSGLDQRAVKTTMKNLQEIFLNGWKALFNVMEKGEIPAGGLKHILPVNKPDQISLPDVSLGQDVNSLVNFEHIFFEARRIAATLGLDLSLAGFSDQMSGGFGEGGWFRMSVQSSEISRSIRLALTPFFNHLVRIHYFIKYGEDLDVSEQFWTIRYFAGMTASQSESNDTEMAKANKVANLIGILDPMKMAGLQESTIYALLTKELGLDDKLATEIAKDLANAASNNEGGGNQGGF